MDFKATLKRARGDIAEMRYAVGEHRAGRGRLNARALREMLDLNMVRADGLLTAMAAQSAARDARADAAAQRARDLAAAVKTARATSDTMPPATSQDDVRPRRLIGGTRAYWQRQPAYWEG